MLNVSNLSLSDVTKAGIHLREMTSDCKSMEEAATRVAHWFYEKFSSSNKESGFALSRVFKTHDYKDLPEDLKKFARGVVQGQDLEGQTKCLTLLGTMGDEKEWQSRKSSQGHQAIPLVDEKFVRNIPMITGLITQLGFEIKDVIQPNLDTIVDNNDEMDFNVFHVEEAKGSPLIPAQKEFVLPKNIRSVLGFGSFLASGNLFAVILFSKQKIPRESAVLFQNLALNVKMALLNFEDQVFANEQ